MANSNRPAGLVPVSYLNGAPWTGGGSVYAIPSNDTNAYAIGDPVTIAGNADTAGIPTVVLSTAGTTNVVTGAVVATSGSIFGSAYFDPTNLNTVVIPATKTKVYYVLVVDDPNVIFEIQEIGTGTVLTAAEVGLNASLVSGTNNGYVSGWMLDNSTEATTAALQLKILRLAPRRDNALGQYAKWWVLINNHTFRTGVAGI